MAFNTLQKLLNLEVNSDFVLWIRQFLCDQLQRASLNTHLGSDPVFFHKLTLNTGIPSDAIFLQFSFPSTHTTFLATIFIKFADGMALVGHLKDDFSGSQYYLQIDLPICRFSSS